MQKRWTLLLVCGLAACGQQEPPPAPASPPVAAPAVESPAPAAPATARKPAPPGAVVYFIEPVNGATVSNPVRVVFGLKGMGVAPAGVERADAGHHHLLIDTPLPENLNLPLPNDEQHRHFGGGQTEVSLMLTPGNHTLQLVLGDNLHVPFDPPIVSDVITIEVQ